MIICSLVFTACDLWLLRKRLACSSFTPSPLILVFVSSGQRSVSPQRGWSRGLPSSGLKAPFPPTVHLSALPGPPPLRGLHAYHIFKYIRKQRGKKRLSSHTTHTTRGLKFYLILPVLKENKRQKRRKKKKDLLLHWSFVFGNMKAGMFSYFFFSEIMHTSLIYIFFCAAWIYAFLRLGWSVCFSSPKASVLFLPS